jgi:hypothetical protein
MQGAAQSNKLAVLQFLHANGCPWDATVAEAAARRGNLEMLKWVREHGCEWTNDIIHGQAASSGNIEKQPGLSSSKG